MVKEIPLNALIRHPENSNHMGSETLKKLRLLIEDAGRYEPLTVTSVLFPSRSRTASHLPATHGSSPGHQSQVLP